MSSPFQSKSSSETVYVALIVIAGLVLGYILYSNGLVPAGVDTTTTTALVPAEAENIAKLEAIKFDFSIFDNIIFRELKVFGEVPVVPGITGKADPFVP